MNQTYSNAENSDRFSYTTYNNFYLLNRKLQIGASFSIAYNMINNDITKEKNGGFEYFYLFNASYQVNSKLSLITRVNAMTNFIFLQTEVNLDKINHSITVNYLPSSKWSFSVEAFQLFKPISKTRINIKGENYSYHSYSTNNDLRLKVSAKYRFGMDIRIKENKRKISNNDLFRN
jgi:hypothetical protein